MVGRGYPLEMAPQREVILLDGYCSPTLGVDLPCGGLSLEDLRGSELLWHITGKGFELSRERLSSSDEETHSTAEGFRGWDGRSNLPL